mgnify:CR=1 FL=1
MNMNEWLKYISEWMFPTHCPIWYFPVHPPLREEKIANQSSRMFYFMMSRNSSLTLIILLFVSNLISDFRVCILFVPLRWNESWPVSWAISFQVKPLLSYSDWALQYSSRCPFASPKFIWWTCTHPVVIYRQVGQSDCLQHYWFHGCHSTPLHTGFKLGLVARGDSCLLSGDL